MKLIPLQIPMLDATDVTSFPSTQDALASPNGLLAWGGDLKTDRILAAYRRGIFPWYSEGEPILWWSPAPRCVLLPDDVYLSTRTRRRYNASKFQIRADTAFEAVIEACSESRPNQPGTWITAEMKNAFSQLHQMGYAHSIEVWSGIKLVGGIYGLALGKVFFGESMYSRETDTSKMALIALCRQLHQWQFGLLDCQVANPHLLSMGAKEIKRSEFESLLDQLTTGENHVGSWQSRFSVQKRW